MLSAAQLKESTAVAQKAAASIGGTFTQGVGFTPNTVPVVTSRAATNDIDKKIKPGYDNAMNSLTQHNTTLTQEKQNEAQAEQQKQAAQGGTPKGSSESGLTTVSDVPYGYNQRQVTYSDGSTAILDQTINDDGSVSYSENPQEAELGKAKSALDKVDKEYQAKADQVSKTIASIQKGSMPLSAGEQAQVSALQQSFSSLIDQQKLTNTGAEGSQNIRGYQTGAAEYDPSFQVKVIGSIVNAGVNKIADLNIKMSGALADLTQSFKDNDIKAIKDSWDIYQDATKERTDTLKDTVTSVQDSIAKVRDAMQKQEAAQLKAEKDAMDFEHKQSQDKIKNDLAQAKFDLSKQKKATTAKGSSGTSSKSASSDAKIESFISDRKNIEAAGNREDFMKVLFNKYPDRDEQSLIDAVMTYYPNGWENE